MEAFTYCWQRKSTREYYIGVHKGTPDDGYIVSGTKFRNTFDNTPREDWERHILSTHDNYEDALKMEEILVDEFQLEDHNCLNLKTGGLNSLPSKEAKANMATAAKGKIISADTRAKMSASAKGRVMSLDTKAKIAASKHKAVECIELATVFDSSQDAADAIGTPKSSISLVCNGYRKTAGGYTWRYV